MPTLTFKSKHTVSSKELYAWHASGGAFERLSPPWHNIEVVKWEGGRNTQSFQAHEQFGDISTGTRVHLQQLVGPLSLSVLAEHVAHEEGSYFVDEMPKGPFAFWRHSHRFLPKSDTESFLLDEIEYELPLKWISWLGGPLVTNELRRLFAFRHRQTFRDLSLHSRYRQDRPRHVLIVGQDQLATKIGSFLRNGHHRVSYLSSQPSVLFGGHSWNDIEPQCFEDSSIDTVVISSVNGDALKSVHAVDDMLSAFAGNRPQSCVLVGCLEPEVDARVFSGFEGLTRMIQLRVPALFEGGYLHFSERHLKHQPRVIDGWCSLDDLLGGILVSIQESSVTGRMNWRAPEAVSAQTINKKGVLTKGSVLSMPNWITSWRFPGLVEQITAKCSSPDHNWLEPALQFHFEDCLTSA